MQGYVTFYNTKKAFGFINGEDNKGYFFHKDDILDSSSNYDLDTNDKVVFTAIKTEKGLRANRIFKLTNSNEKNMKNIKHNINYKGTEEEVIISNKFSEFLELTFSREEKFKRATYYFNFLKPSKTYKESFNMFNEVLMLFSTFPNYDDRAMDYVDKLFMDYSNRLDPVVIILISKDNEIKQKIKRNNASNHESRIIVPFSYDEIINGQFNEKLFQSRLREYFYQRDLFAMESPLNSDNYFYGRSNIVHNFFDKYSIGEQTGLFGLRKTGKTSVLYALQRLVDTRSGMSIYIDCQSPGIYNLRWFELLEAMVFKVYEKYSIDYDSSTNKFHEKNAADNFLQKIREINKLTGKRILFIFDEIEHITYELSNNEKWNSGEDYLSFWQTIRSIIQTEKNLCAFVIAGVNPKITEQVSINGLDNPIFSNISVTYLSLFTLEDVKNMISEIGAYMGLSFDEAVYHKLHTNYGGHPFLIRNVCSMLNKHFKERPYRITGRDYDDYKEEIDSELISYIRSILFVLEKWYILEFEILKDIALDNKDSYLEKISEDRLSIIHLLGYGVITQSVKNNYYIEIDAITNYMKENYRYEKIPINSEMSREIISSRRNQIEKKLRIITRQVLTLKYGRDKSPQIIEKYVNTSLDSILKRREGKELIDCLFFSELKNVIFGEYQSFSNVFTMEKSIFMSAMNTINKFREVDAHASEISESDYRTLHICFTEIEDSLKNF
ncbi:cold shock domain-containing protein [Exiguobacterium acetylicum]|uniref:cold shock domain-containing protein n=1 Tax=Exiguobacterium acetylicum TaxID=41170 RepID=UPI0011ECB393|nr:cold shock domain-containing protein [Exiguobacterium acetylicum]